MPLDDAHATETELKFRLRPGAYAILAADPLFEAQEPAANLRSVYFDTPDYDLRRLGLSLRIRERDGAFVQTLKERNGGILARGEWEAVVDRCEPTLNALSESKARRMAAGFATQLAPVFVTVFSRRTARWVGECAEIELSLDQGEIVTGDGVQVLEELELELAQGDPAALFSLGRDLAARVGLTPSFQSKAERGYRLAGHEGAASLPAESADLTPDDTPRQALNRVLQSCARQIEANAEFFVSGRSPRALHQIRVGARRLRAALKVFASAIDPTRSLALKSEGAWLAGELDAARDIDVFAGRYLGDLDETARDSDLAALQMKTLEAQARAYNAAEAALASPRFADLLLALAAAVELPDSPRAEIAPGSDAPLGEMARASLARLHARVRKGCRRFEDLDEAALHRLRLKLKTLRYAAEFFTPVAGLRKRRMASYTAALRVLQDRLGDLTDLAAARQTALRIVGTRASALALAAGVVIACDPQKIAKAHRRAEKATRKFLALEAP